MTKQTKFLDQIDAETTARSWLMEIYKSVPNLTLWQSPDDSHSQVSPKLKSVFLFDEHDCTYAGFTISRDAKNWTEVRYIEPPLSNQLNEFRKGARAMYDYLADRAANNWHGNPNTDEQCQQENKLVMSWAEDALSAVSPEDHNEWIMITKCVEEIRQLKEMIKTLK